jgi:hypothetical protein
MFSKLCMTYDDYIKTIGWMEKGTERINGKSDR